MKKPKFEPQVIEDGGDGELNIFNRPENITVYLCNSSNLISLLRENYNGVEVQNIVHIHYLDIKKDAKRLGEMAEKNLRDDYFD